MNAKEIAARHMAAFNAHDEAAHMAGETPDIEWVQPGVGPLRGPDQVIQAQRILWDALPDATIEPVNQIDDGTTVVTEGILNGTHTGTLRTPAGDIPASGNRVSLRYVTVQRLRDELVESEHLYFDQLEFLTQLGAIPAPTV
jgi:steroid delta-isomerase-like uncharacterized protein